VAERKTWIRAAAVFYPVVMAATVVISGNHWILDVVGAVITVAVAGSSITLLSWLSGHVVPRSLLPAPIVEGSRR
jgi:membrane-associated phospholipid phosphatase